MGHDFLCMLSLHIIIILSYWANVFFILTSQYFYRGVIFARNLVQLLVAVSQDAPKHFITNVDEREARCFSSSTASSKPSCLIQDKFTQGDDQNMTLQGNLFSGDNLGTEASGPWIEVSPEWRLGLGLLRINHQRQYKNIITNLSLWHYT